VKMFYHLYFLIDPLSISNKGIRYFRRHAETYQTKKFTYGDFKILVLIICAFGPFFRPPKKKGLCMSSTGFFLSFFLSSAGYQISSPGKTLVGTWESKSSSQSMPAFRSSFSKHPIIRGVLQSWNYS